MSSTLVRRVTFAVAFSVSMWSSLANSFLPESGWYWNPSESGRGFNIEIQDNLFFMAGFIYDANRNPIWLVSGGAMSSDRTYSGDLLITGGGQCIGCSYSAPTESKWGSVSVNFTGPLKATIVVNGVAIPAQRQDWGTHTDSPVTPLFGEWSLVDGSKTSALYFGERITFTGPFTSTSTGKVYAQGGRTGSIASRVAIGRYEESIGEWLILLDASTSYYTAYRLTLMGLNRVEGQSITYLKTTTSPPTSGLPSVGTRTASAAAVAGKSAPATDKALPATTVEANEKSMTIKASILEVDWPRATLDAVLELQSALVEAQR